MDILSDVYMYTYRVPRNYECQKGKQTSAIGQGSRVDVEVILDLIQF